MTRHIEPEVLTAQLKAWGCPYSSTDPKCSIWLAGYRNGHSDGYRAAAKAVGVVLPEKVGP